MGSVPCPLPSQRFHALFPSQRLHVLHRHRFRLASAKADIHVGLVQEQLHFNGQEDAHQRALYEERSLYCMGLPPLWTSTQVGDFFGRRGDVEDVYLREPKP